MANQVFDAVRTVLAVREYEQRPVPEDVIERILESARLTASSMNLQPWHFVVVKEREHLSQLGELVKTGPYVSGAAFAVIVAYLKGSRFGISDASRAIQSMVLTAWAEGVGSNWTGFAGMEKVRSWASLPDEYDVLAVVPFGYPRRKLGKGKKQRREFDEVISEENFRTDDPG